MRLHTLEDDQNDHISLSQTKASLTSVEEEKAALRFLHEDISWMENA